VTSEPWVPCETANPDFRVIPESRSSRWLLDPAFPSESGVPEQFRVTPVPRNTYGWLRDPATVPGDSGIFKSSRESGKPGFPATPESRIVPRESGFPGQFRVTPWSRMCFGGAPGSRKNSEWLQEPGVPGEHGNSAFRVASEARSSWWLRESGVPDDSGNTEYSGLFQEPGILVFAGSRVLLVTPGTRSTPDDPGNLDYSEWPREPGVIRMTPGTRNFRWLETLFSGVSGIPESFGWLRGPESSGWLREEGVILVTTGARSSGWAREPASSGSLSLRETEVKGDSGNPGFRVTLGTRGSGWFREAGVLGDSGNPELHWLREPLFPADSGNTEISEWLREPGVPTVSVHKATGDSGKTKSFRWLREPRVLQVT